jgi:hypothetical protein
MKLLEFDPTSETPNQHRIFQKKSVQCHITVEGGKAPLPCKCEIPTPRYFRRLNFARRFEVCHRLSVQEGNLLDDL